MQEEQLFPEILTVLWYRSRTNPNQKPDEDIPPLKPDEVNSLRAGLAAVVHNAHLFDALFEFYLNVSSVQTEWDTELPDDLRDRFLTRGPGALSPNELTQLATTPVWVAGLRDAVVADPATLATSDHPVIAEKPYLGLARAEIRRVHSSFNPLRQHDDQELFGVVLKRVFGPKPVVLESFPNFVDDLNAAIAEFRESTRGISPGPIIKPNLRNEPSLSVPKQCPQGSSKVLGQASSNRPEGRNKLALCLALVAFIAVVTTLIWRVSHRPSEIEGQPNEPKSVAQISPDESRLLKNEIEGVGPVDVRSPKNAIAKGGDEYRLTFQVATPRTQAMLFQIESEKIHRLGKFNRGSNGTMSVESFRDRFGETEGYELLVLILVDEERQHSRIALFVCNT